MTSPAPALPLVRESSIPGLFFLDLDLRSDSRGWFKENYQLAKMEGVGLPHFDIVQNNISFNAEVGVTRGLHAEPWEKYISVANGRVYGAWVDLRDGVSYGRVESIEITPDVAVFVPRGVANGFQTLEPNVAYTYLLNEHWSPAATYTLINAFDPALGIAWPIDRADAIVSDKDAGHPNLADL